MTRVFTNNERGTAAEAAALSLSNEAGLTPSSPTKDEHGFDLYVNVPLATPTERFLFGSMPALFQVKGTTGTRIAVKLNVWRKLLEAPVPTFFIVYTYANRQTLKSSRVFLVHIHGDLLSGAAERLWTAKRGSRQTMDLTWSDSDELVAGTGDELLAQLRAGIGDAARYVQGKIAARETAGHGDHPMRFLLRRTLAAGESIDRELAEFAVGLRTELPVDRVDAYEERFGVEQRSEERSIAGGALIAWPGESVPSEPCSVVFTAKKTGEEIRVDARIAVSTRVFPWLKGENAIIRIIHQVVDFVIGPNRAPITFTIRVPTGTAALDQIAAADRVYSFLETGDCDVELRALGAPPYLLTLAGPVTTTGMPLEHREVLEAATLALDVVRRVGIRDDIHASPELLRAALDGFRRTGALLRHADGELSFAMEMPSVEPNTTLAFLIVTWHHLAGDLVAFHGIIFGPAENDGERVVVPRARGRLLVARRIRAGRALPPEAQRGFVDEAMLKIREDKSITGLIGESQGYAAWERTRADLLAQRVIEAS